MLLKAEDLNPDGAGIAWREKKLIKFKKGLGAYKLHKFTRDLELPYIIHFRLATSGSIIPAMNQPFVVNSKGTKTPEGTAKEVLFHNGHESKWQDILLNILIEKGAKNLPKGELNDSRALAIGYNYLGKKFLHKVSGKFAIFNSKIIETIGWFERYKGMDIKLSSDIESTYWYENYYTMGSDSGLPVKGKALTNTCRACQGYLENGLCQSCSENDYHQPNNNDYPSPMEHICSRCGLYKHNIDYYCLGEDKSGGECKYYLKLMALSEAGELH